MAQLEQQIDICNTQITDLQQKLIDADQGASVCLSVCLPPCLSVSESLSVCLSACQCVCLCLSSACVYSTEIVAANLMADNYACMKAVCDKLNSELHLCLCVCVDCFICSLSVCCTLCVLITNNDDEQRSCHCAADTVIFEHQVSTA